MAQPAVDWFVTLFFLFSLIAIVRFRSHMRSVDKESYRYITAGLVVLTFVALARLYNSQGIFLQIPFLAEPLFYRLVSWIGIITGITFIISGMSGWLPLAKRAHLHDADTLSRANLLREIEQLALVEHRIDNLFAGTLEHMVKAYRFSQGAVYKCDSTGRDIRLVSQRHCRTVEQNDLMRVTMNIDGWIRFTEGVRSESAGLLNALPEKLGTPCMVLPVVVDSKPRGVFVLWNQDDVEFESRELVNLKLAAEILARKLDLSRKTLTAEFLTRCESVRRQAETILSAQGDSIDSLSEIVRTLRTVEVAPYVSLMICRPDGRYYDQHTVGLNGQLLSLTSQPMAARSAPRAMFDSATDGHMNTLKNETESPLLEILPGEFQSAAIAVVRDRGNTTGVLVMADYYPNRFGAGTDTLLDIVRPVVTQLVAAERSRIEHERFAARMKRLATDVARASSSTAGLRLVARSLREETNLDMVRISRVDSTGAFLNSRALSAETLPAGAAPETADLVISLLPHHERAIENRRTVMVASSGEIGEAEASLVYERSMQCLAVIPVIADNGETCVVTLADSGDENALSEDVMTLATMAAEMLAAGAMQTETSDRTTVLPPVPEAGRLELDADTRTHLRSSLTGILGSLEVLQGRDLTNAEQTGRYLSIIDRSAHRLHDYLEGVPQKADASSRQ